VAGFAQCGSRLAQELRIIGNVRRVAFAATSHLVGCVQFDRRLRLWLGIMTVAAKLFFLFNETDLASWCRRFVARGAVSIRKWLVHVLAQ
jgi:hypothetical protein